MRTFEYRLYANRAQRQQLKACLVESRAISNEMLSALKAPYETDGAPTRDVWLDEDATHLHVPATLGKTLKMKVHRPLVGTPVTAHLVLRADNHWYVLMSVRGRRRMSGIAGVLSRWHAPMRPCAHPAIRLDVGLRVFLADSDGGSVANPGHYRRGQKRLAHAQRTHCRRKKGSRRRRKAAREVACKHLKIARQRRQRRDVHLKSAKPYAERYSHLCVEDLNAAGMVRNHTLAKSIHDASWSAFLAYLADHGCKS